MSAERLETLEACQIGLLGFIHLGLGNSVKIMARFLWNAQQRLRINMIGVDNHVEIVGHIFAANTSHCIYGVFKPRGNA